MAILVNGSVEPYVRAETDQTPPRQRAAEGATVALHDELHNATSARVIGHQHVVRNTTFNEYNAVTTGTKTNDAGQVTRLPQVSVGQWSEDRPYAERQIRREHVVQDALLRRDGTVDVKATTDGNAIGASLHAQSTSHYAVDGSASEHRTTSMADGPVHSTYVTDVHRSPNGVQQFSFQETIVSPNSDGNDGSTRIVGHGLLRPDNTGYRYSHTVGRDMSGIIDHDLWKTDECRHVGGNQSRIECVFREVGFENGRIPVDVTYTYQRQHGVEGPFDRIRPIQPKPDVHPNVHPRGANGSEG
jgi:hypothetical protein